MLKLLNEIDNVVPKKGLFKRSGYFLNKLLKDIVTTLGGNSGGKSDTIFFCMNGNNIAPGNTYEVWDYEMKDILGIEYDEYLKLRKSQSLPILNVKWSEDGGYTMPSYLAAYSDYETSDMIYFDLTGLLMNILIYYKDIDPSIYPVAIINFGSNES